MKPTHLLANAIQRLALWGICLLPVSAFAQPTDALLADTAKPPTAEVSWTKRDGTVVAFKGERLYKSPAGKSYLGANVDCYVALGGTRLDKGQGSPGGAIVRVGLYKRDLTKPFFDNIAPGSSVTLAVRGIRMNQPAKPNPKTALMHLRYGMTDLKNCGLDATARNLFNLADPNDPLIEFVQADSVRPDGLDGKNPDHGTVNAVALDDGSVTFSITFPYALLRHLRDPYQRSDPGTFFEPEHFHAEIELMPRAAAAPRSQPAPPAPSATGDR